jgi:2-polyprenyl-6-methoxyphenol hydroxylase-like FAD-dependent oxidoreductase
VSSAASDADAPVDTDVLIVGAGPTGLTLAVELRRRGVDCRLIERADGSVETSRAISIQPRTLQLLGDLDVLEDVMDEGTRVGGLTGYRDGEALFSLDADVVDVPSQYPYLWHLPQNRTERLLRARLRELGGRVEFQRELVGFGQGRDRVTATVRHRDADRAERVRARWLVGADGGSSRVRKTLGVPFEGDTQEEQFLVADATVDWDRPDDDAALWFHPDGLFVVFPMPDGRWRLFADVGEYAPSRRPDASAETFERLLRERTHEGGAIRTTDWTSEFTVNQRLAAAYRRGRAFLAGDAAHVHVPLGGVGMNTGIQDAYNLGWKLAAVVAGRAPDRLVDTYEPERRPVAAAVVESTGPSISVLADDSTPVRLLRDRVGAALLDAPTVHRRILRADTQLDVTYRHGPLSDAHSEAPLRSLLDGDDLLGAARDDWGGPVAGDRAPETTLTRADGSEVSLHRRLRGPDFSLVAFAGPTATPAAAAGLRARVDRIARAAGDAVDVPVVIEAGRPTDRAVEAGREADATASEADPERAVATTDGGPPAGGRLFDPAGEAHETYGATRATLFVVRPDDYVGFRSRPLHSGHVLSYLRGTVGLDAH